MAQSAAFEALLANKQNNQVKFRVIWKLDAGDQDITKYYLSGGSFAQEKERPPARLTAGDSTIVFDNSSGVFSEMSSTSFLYGVNYHNRKITFEVGLELSDGTIEYYLVATMLVSDVNFSADNNQVTVHVYDAITRLLNLVINQTPSNLSTPTYGGGNVGNGTISAIATMPFVTKSETWTLTCITLGGDGTAQFNVVGSVSGNIGVATSGAEFSNPVTGGIKFTIKAGGTNWAVSDTIVFVTSQMMEWTAVNPVKIMWSILTGYNWDTNTKDAWYSRSALLDPTQSVANVDLDYTGFSTAITTAALYFTITGFVPWDYSLSDAIEEINMLFLGAFPVTATGLLSVKFFKPALATAPADFSDTKKNVAMNYIRDTRDVINQVTIRYRKTTLYPWSDDDQIGTLDGVYVANNATSQTNLKQIYAFPQPLTTRWYNATAAHVAYLGLRIIDKYGRPPIRFTVQTGIDGIEQNIGDIISVTDVKTNFTTYATEIMKKEGNYDQLPLQIIFTTEDTGTFGINWAFLGSTANEGDGMSPQASLYDNASATDKYFCYLSQNGQTTAPTYYMF